MNMPEIIYRHTVHLQKPSEWGGLEKEAVD